VYRCFLTLSVAFPFIFLILLSRPFFLEHVLLSLTRYFVVLPCLGHLLNFTILPIVFQTFGMGGGLYYDLLYPIAQISFGFSLTSTKLRYMRGVASESIVII